MIRFDLGKKDEKTMGYCKEPVVQSSVSTGKHMDPVWQVRWCREDSNGKCPVNHVSVEESSFSSEESLKNLHFLVKNLQF